MLIFCYQEDFKVAWLPCGDTLNRRVYWEEEQPDTFPCQRSRCGYTGRCTSTRTERTPWLQYDSCDLHNHLYKKPCYVHWGHSGLGLGKRFREYFHTVEGYHHYRLFNYRWFSIAYRFNLLELNSTSDMSWPEIRKVMRGSARRKEKGSWSEMGLVFAHKALLPREINNELKLNVAFCTLFQLSCSQSTRADAVSRFPSISRELNVTALLAYQSRYRVFFQWYQPIKSSFPNRFHAGDLINFCVFLLALPRKSSLVILSHLGLHKIHLQRWKNA